jgi:hypothetical protein
MLPWVQKCCETIPGLPFVETQRCRGSVGHEHIRKGVVSIATAGAKRFDFA